MSFVLQIDVDKAIQDERIAKLKDTYETIYSEITLDWETVQHELHNSCALEFLCKQLTRGMVKILVMTNIKMAYV